MIKHDKASSISRTYVSENTVYMCLSTKHSYRRTPHRRKKQKLFAKGKKCSTFWLWLFGKADLGANNFSAFWLVYCLLLIFLYVQLHGKAAYTLETTFQLSTFRYSHLQVGLCVFVCFLGRCLVCALRLQVPWLSSLASLRSAYLILQQFSTTAEIPVD